MSTLLLLALLAAKSKPKPAPAVPVFKAPVVVDVQSLLRKAPFGADVVTVLKALPKEAVYLPRNPEEDVDGTSVLAIVEWVDAYGERFFGRLSFTQTTQELTRVDLLHTAALTPPERFQYMDCRLREELGKPAESQAGRSFWRAARFGDGPVNLTLRHVNKPAYEVQVLWLHARPDAP